MKNILCDSRLENLADVFKLLASPARLRILLTIGEGETCVCHLVAALGWRQAYISQQLMLMREAGLLQARREGRFIYYSLRNKDWLDVIFQAAGVLKMPDLKLDLRLDAPDGCTCPACRSA